MAKVSKKKTKKTAAAAAGTPKDGDVAMLVKIPAELRREMKVYAATNDVTMKTIVMEAVTAYLGS